MFSLQKLTKKYFLLTVFLLVLLQSGGSVFAVENPLNTITLEGNPYSSFLVGTNNLYVVSKEEKRLYKVNTSTNKFYGSSGLDSGPTLGLVSNDRIYFLNSEDNAVTVFYSTGSYKTKIIVGSGPIGIVAVGTRMYVSSFDDTMSVIEAGADSRIKNVKLLAGATSPYFTVSGNRIFLHHPINNSISVWSTSSNTVIKNIPVGQSPQMSVLVGKKLYVVNTKSNDISVVNTDDYTISKTISVGNGPIFALVKGTKLYVLNAESNNLSVIDTTNDSVTKTVSVGKNPSSMTLSENFIYITNTDDDSVSFFDTVNETVTKTLTVGDAPKSATVVGKKLYVNNTKSKSISFINTASPSLSSITTATENGTYSEATTIKIEAKFDQYIGQDSSMSLILDNNREVVLKTAESMTLSGEYVVQGGDDTKDLTVKGIKDANIIGLFGHDSKNYTLPVNNLGKLKNIVIKTNGVSKTPVVSLCPVNRLYRLCPLEKTPENTADYRDNLVCENIITEAQSQKKTKRISRIEVLEMAVNMLHLQRASAEEYDQVYTDIALSDQSETLELIQTGLRYKLISPTYQSFEPKKNISRIEAYALLMRSVCMEPETTESPARSIHQKAYQEGITTKQWARFRPNSMITRSEVYILASQLADWADKNGGCDRLVCRK